MIDRLRPLFTALHPQPLAPEDAEAIIAISQLVIDIDGREGPAEIEMFFAIGSLLHELAGTPGAEIPTFASDEDDEARMFELASQLKGAPARELAYVIGRALAATDLDVSPEEDTFLDRLRGVLFLSQPRATELATLLR